MFMPRCRTARLDGAQGRRLCRRLAPGRSRRSGSLDQAWSWISVSREHRLDEAKGDKEKTYLAERDTPGQKPGIEAMASDSYSSGRSAHLSQVSQRHQRTTASRYSHRSCLLYDRWRRCPSSRLIRSAHCFQETLLSEGSNPSGDCGTTTRQKKCSSSICHVLPPMITLSLETVGGKCCVCVQCDVVGRGTEVRVEASMASVYAYCLV
jgi:hypothetical protein